MSNGTPVALGGIAVDSVIGTVEHMLALESAPGYQPGAIYAQLARVVNELRDTDDALVVPVAVTTVAGQGEYPVGGNDAEQYDRINSVVWPEAWLRSSTIGPSHTVGSEVMGNEMEYARLQLRYLTIAEFRPWQAGVTANGSTAEVPGYWSLYRNESNQLVLCVGDRAAVQGGETITVYCTYVRKVEYLPGQQILVENVWERWIVLSLCERMAQYASGLRQRENDFTGANYYDQRAASYRAEAAQEHEEVRKRRVWRMHAQPKRRHTPFFPNTTDDE